MSDASPPTITITHAQNFLESAWQILPALDHDAATPQVRADMSSLYRTMLSVAQKHPALLPGFAAHATAFAQANPAWASRIALDIMTISQQVPAITPIALEASWHALAHHRASITDNLQKQVEAICAALLDSARLSGDEMAFVTKGVDALPSIAANSLFTAEYVLKSLFDVADKNQTGHTDIAHALQKIFASTAKDTGMLVMPLIDIALKRTGRQPAILDIILDDAGAVIKDTARTLPPRYMEKSIITMIGIAGSDDALLARVVTMGRDALTESMKTGFAASPILQAALSEKQAGTAPAPVLI